MVISSFSTAGLQSTCLKLQLSKQYCLARYLKKKKSLLWRSNRFIVQLLLIQFQLNFEVNNFEVVDTFMQDSDGKFISKMIIASSYDADILSKLGKALIDI